MKLLLDTHVWIWSQAAPDNLSARVRRALQNEANEVWFSPTSIWELILLVENRRLALEGDLIEWFRKAAAPLKEGPLTADIVAEAARFRLPHSDPADRFLVATARSLGLTLVTADTHILASEAVPTLANR